MHPSWKYSVRPNACLRVKLFCQRKQVQLLQHTLNGAKSMYLFSYLGDCRKFYVWFHFPCIKIFYCLNARMASSRKDNCHHRAIIKFNISIPKDSHPKKLTYSSKILTAILFLFFYSLKRPMHPLDISKLLFSSHNFWSYKNWISSINTNICTMFRHDSVILRFCNFEML